MTRNPQAVMADARAWLKNDPDPETGAALSEELFKAIGGDLVSQQFLVQRFTGRLNFGTAGIRGLLGFGPQAVNRVVVSQTTHGLAKYLLSKSATGSKPLRVIIGYDAGKNSDRFAFNSAAVLAGNGIYVLITTTPVPTPLMTFGIRHLSCDATIVVTASHNPFTDNGYKVYLGREDQESQLIPPVDAEIEHHISEIAGNLTWEDIPLSTDLISPAPTTLLDAYVSNTIDAVSAEPPASPNLRAMYTPLHGVGSKTFMALLD